MSSTVDGVGIADAPASGEIDRRTILKLGLFGTIAAMGGLVVKNLADYMGEFGISPTGAVFTGHTGQFHPGMTPIHFMSPYGRFGFWLVYIIPEYGGEGQHEGLLALADILDYGRSPARWRQDLSINGQTGYFVGAFRCSQFTYSGVRIFGPASRNMDTMEIEINKFGNVIVHTRRVAKGGSSPGANAARAVRI
jgi:hypothetical protein